MVQLKKYDMTVSEGGVYGICNGWRTNKAVHSHSIFRRGGIEGINRWFNSEDWYYEPVESLVLPSELMS